MKEIAVLLETNRNLSNDRDAVVKGSGLKENKLKNKKKNKVLRMTALVEALHATFADITRHCIRIEAVRGCPLIPIAIEHG